VASVRIYHMSYSSLDFCLWGPPDPNSVIGDVEGEVVAYCSKKGHGTRLIPSGALKGVQLLKTPDYIQVAGFIDQSQINIKSDDDGGELDPYGADLQGNPIGGLIYSNGWSKDNNSYTQVIDWTKYVYSLYVIPSVTLCPHQLHGRQHVLHQDMRSRWEEPQGLLPTHLRPNWMQSQCASRICERNVREVRRGQYATPWRIRLRWTNHDVHSASRVSGSHHPSPVHCAPS
jgi:hypothetical protein